MMFFHYRARILHSYCLIVRASTFERLNVYRGVIEDLKGRLQRATSVFCIVE